MNNEQRNVLLAIVLSVMILIGWQMFLLPTPEEVQEQIDSQAALESTTPQPTADGQGTVPGAGVDPFSILPRTEVIAQGDRVQIRSDRVEGSIRLAGARIDDIVLLEHTNTPDPDSGNVVLFSPANTQNPYYAEFGWSAIDGEGFDVPGADTVWTASNSELTPTSPVTLSWTNDQNVTFNRTLSLDENFMITVEQSVTNNSGNLITLFPYGLVSRTGTPETEGIFILHEGLIGVFDEILEEIDYDDMQDDPAGTSAFTSTGGWIGITDKFWLAALVPDQSREVTGTFRHSAPNNVDRYQTDYLYSQGIAIAPGTTESVTNRLFAGAKVVGMLDGYVDDLGIVNFDLAVDFGWFYWITKPLYQVLHFFYELSGNFGISIIIVTILVKLAFFPLANTSYRAMSRMRKLQPQMMELREKHGDDRQAMSQDMMELYKREKVNPMAGCLPIIVQIPVFFALYKTLYVTLEMRHAPFILWLKDLSAPDPTSFWNLFGLIPWDPSQYIPAILSIGILPIIMGLTMYLQQKLNPQPMDEMQKRIFAIMPFMFTFLLATFPSGLVLYWTVNNILSIAQQWVIMKRDDSI